MNAMAIVPRHSGPDRAHINKRFNSMNARFSKIEHWEDRAFAVHFKDYVAIYRTLEELAWAVRHDAIIVDSGDREYYESRSWLPVSRRQLADFGLYQRGE